MSENKISMDVALGGAHFTVEAKNGKTENVFVKTASLSECEELVKAAYSLTGLIKLTTGRGPEWVDLLKPESGIALYDFALEQNRFILGLWQERVMKLVTTLSAQSVTPSQKQA